LSGNRGPVSFFLLLLLLAFKGLFLHALFPRWKDGVHRHIYICSYKQKSGSTKKIDLAHIFFSFFSFPRRSTAKASLLDSGITTRPQKCKEGGGTGQMAPFFTSSSSAHIDSLILFFFGALSLLLPSKQNNHRRNLVITRSPGNFIDPLRPVQR
jgi:hypothetical protein